MPYSLWIPPRYNIHPRYFTESLFGSYDLSSLSDLNRRRENGTTENVSNNKLRSTTIIHLVHLHRSLPMIRRIFSFFFLVDLIFKAARPRQSSVRSVCKIQWDEIVFYNNRIIKRYGYTLWIIMKSCIAIELKNNTEGIGNNK